MAVNKERVLRNIERLRSKGNWDRAIAETEKLSQEDFSSDTSLDNIRGDLYLQKGDLPRAIECYLRAAEFYEEQGFAIKAIAM